ncbi:citrate (pro-3S)-lyase, beta subunit [Weissella viridescens]|uniref:Citrate (Pro-3S)-lyase, beta subunit n=1 Tax=Weissella viridescens TaxID=1629 RepID=A0A380P1X2_WEIVI|nr:citrate (pro-3S)-lyase, beta subunit [Weissella viridescens]
MIAAIEEARAKGSGVISMNGQMVDRPVVLRAERVMRLAKASHLVDEEGNYIGNSVKRELPDELMNKLDYKPFETVDFGNPEIQRVAPKVRATTGKNKLVDSLEKRLLIMLKMV